MKEMESLGWFTSGKERFHRLKTREEYINTNWTTSWSENGMVDIESKKRRSIGWMARYLLGTCRSMQFSYQPYLITPSILYLRNSSTYDKAHHPVHTLPTKFTGSCSRDHCFSLFATGSTFFFLENNIHLLKKKIKK